MTATPRSLLDALVFSNFWMAAAAAALVAAAALASLYFGARAGWPATLMLLPVLGVGLFHRRLKRFENAKILYIAAAWTCVGFGLPAVLEPNARNLHWVAAIVAATMVANVIAFNVRDEQAHVGRVRRRGVLIATALA